MFFPPVVSFFIILYLVILVALFTVFQVGVITFVFTRIGVPPEVVLFLLFLSLMGSFVNIPLKRLPCDLEQSGRVIGFYGWKFTVPAVCRNKETILAINLGGAIVPAATSFYLAAVNADIFLQILSATAIVSFIVFRFARPLKGVGIVIPTLIPPIAAALVAVLISQPDAPIIAYIAGSLGTLIGADLLNLDKIAGLGAPVASIGGAGTFDGVFLTGVLAVILTSLQV